MKMSDELPLEWLAYQITPRVHQQVIQKVTKKSRTTDKVLQTSVA